jgi:hypothetical protein
MVNVVFTLFNDVMDNNTTRYAEASWDEFREQYLSSHEIMENKEDQWLFNGWFYSGNNGRGKSAEYAKFCTMLVLDYDDDTAIEEVQAMISDYEYVLYTSHNHLIKGIRFRVVLPLAKWIKIEDWSVRKRNFLKMFPGVDISTTSNARVFYLPSCPESHEKHARIIHNQGRFFDAHRIPKERKRRRAIVERKQYPDTDKQELLDKLCLLNLSGDAGGENYNIWMSIGTAMYQCGYSIEDFRVFTRAVKPNHESEVEQKWNDFQRYSGTKTLGTLIHYANNGV